MVDVDREIRGSSTLKYEKPLKSENNYIKIYQLDAKLNNKILNFVSI